MHRHLPADAAPRSLEQPKPDLEHHTDVVIGSACSPVKIVKRGLPAGAFGQDIEAFLKEGTATDVPRSWIGGRDAFDRITIPLKNDCGAVSGIGEMKPAMRLHCSSMAGGGPCCEREIDAVGREDYGVISPTSKMLDDDDRPGVPFEHYPRAVRIHPSAPHSFCTMVCEVIPNNAG